MNAFNTTHFQSSKLPKYQQFVNYILNGIHNGEIREGEKLPSIVNSSIEFDISRDTVGRAYKELYSRGIITSVYRKGYFVTQNISKNKNKRVLFITGKYTTNNLILFQKLSKEFDKKSVEMDFIQNHNSISNMEAIVEKESGNYHFFLVEPQLLEQIELLRIFRNKMISKKVIFLQDEANRQLLERSCSVCKVKRGLTQTFNSLVEKFQAYQELFLVLPESEYFSSEIITEFFAFCDEHDIKGRVLDEVSKIERKCLYLVIDEGSLFPLLELMKTQKMELKKDLGLITLFEKNYLEFLYNGITSISWDNATLAESLLSHITSNKEQAILNSTKLRLRGSI